MSMKEATTYVIYVSTSYMNVAGSCAIFADVVTVSATFPVLLFFITTLNLKQ